MERWFAQLTDKRLRRSAFTGVKELEQAINDYIKKNNENPKPFIWTASADVILNKVQRVCERINRSGH